MLSLMADILFSLFDSVHKQHVCKALLGDDVTCPTSRLIGQCVTCDRRLRNFGHFARRQETKKKKTIRTLDCATTGSPVIKSLLLCKSLS